MESRREHFERIAQEHLKTVQLGDDAHVEVGGPSTQILQTPQGMMVEVGFCFLLSLGHSLLDVPPVTAPGIVPTAEIPDAQVKNIVNQLLEAARKVRDNLNQIPDGEDFGANLRGNPVKLG